jgi:hypothetical protein
LGRLKDGKARGLGEYCRFIFDQDRYERFDASKNALWIVTDIEGTDLKGEQLPAPVKRLGEGVVVEAAIGDYKNIKVIGFVPDSVHSHGGKALLGAVRLRKLPVTDKE